MEITLADGLDFPFSAQDLAEEINALPVQWGDINAEGLFASRTIATTVAEIGYRNGEIVVLGTKERGEPGPVLRGQGERKIYLEVPHIPALSVLKPADLQDKVVFGSGGERLSKLALTVNDHLTTHRTDHDQTLELLRVGALKGVVVDGDLNEVYNLFDVFGVTKKVIDFNLDNAEIDVHDKCDELVDHITDNLRGDVMSGTRVRCSRQFFRKLTKHPSVVKFYEGHSAMATLQAGIGAGLFTFGNVVWQVYRGSVSNIKGQSIKFFDDGKGQAYPVGTKQTFRTFWAPPDDLSMVNTEFEGVHVSLEPLKHGKGLEIHSESNVLPVCVRPQVLVEVLDDGNPADND